MFIFTIKFFCAQGFASDKKGTTETIGDILQFGLPAIAYSSTFLWMSLKGGMSFIGHFSPMSLQLKH
jgi:hypothetical protein